MTDDARHRQGNCVLNPRRSEFLSLRTVRPSVPPSRYFASLLAVSLIFLSIILIASVYELARFR